MAISVAWQTTATITAVTSTALYTTPTASTAAYYLARDLVLNNSGTVNCFLSLGAAATSAATASSFIVPPGGTVILTECQVPVTTIVWGMASLACPVSIGYATNVNYF